MHSPRQSTVFALLLFSLLLPFTARAAEYQWGYVMPEEPATSQLWGKSPFFLYIPPNEALRCSSRPFARTHHASPHRRAGTRQAR
jgi:hypothetical protein